MITKEYATATIRRCINAINADAFLPAQACRNAGTSKRQLRQIAEEYANDVDIDALLNEFAFRCGAYLWQAIIAWKINFTVALFAYRTFFPIKKNPNEQISRKNPGQSAEAGKSRQ